MQISEEDFGLLLELTRIRAGLSQEQMAKHCKISLSAVQQFERGENFQKLNTRVVKEWGKKTQRSGLLAVGFSAYLGDTNESLKSLIEMVQANTRFQVGEELLHAIKKPT
jgi:transcriptional regulator with XRE-family HTH domain